MIKHLTLALCISLPLVALADGDNKERKKERDDKKPVAEMPVQAGPDGAKPKRTEHNVRKAEITRQQSRRSAMGVCMKAATDQGLSGEDLKKSVGTCMQGQ